MFWFRSSTIIAVCLVLLSINLDIRSMEKSDLMNGCEDLEAAAVTAFKDLGYNETCIEDHIKNLKSEQGLLYGFTSNCGHQLLSCGTKEVKNYIEIYKLLAPLWKEDTTTKLLCYNTLRSFIHSASIEIEDKESEKAKAMTTLLQTFSS